MWVPEVMTHLGDIGAIEAGGRLDGQGLHVRSVGVVNELRFLWRQLLFSHSGVSPRQALKEAAKLTWRLIRLLLNETDIWKDSRLDQEAERLFLTTSLVPVAIIGMKGDLIQRAHIRNHTDADQTSAAIPEIILHANSVARDPGLQAFLRRVAESVRRKARGYPPQSSALTSTGQVMFGFS